MHIIVHAHTDDEVHEAPDCARVQAASATTQITSNADEIFILDGSWKIAAMYGSVIREKF
jgi:hypothetical protein